jgi:hypothetical protein
MAAIITMSAIRKVRLKIRLAPKPVRTVSCVVAAGVALRGTAGRLIVAAAPPTTVAAMLASAWPSSRSQLAAHSGFALSERAVTKIVVNGSKRSAAVHHNLVVTTDYKNGRRRRPDDFFEKGNSWPLWRRAIP